MEHAMEGLDRDAVLARYRRYRAITRAHNSRILKQLPGDAFLEQARRIGLAQGGALGPTDVDDLFLALDLAIHTGPPDRTRLIDRYVRTAGAEPGSDDERVLEAMRRARLAILGVERAHDIAGLVVRDVSDLGELWLLDEHLASSAATGLFAARFFDLDGFHMTTGVIIPVDEALLRKVLVEASFLAGRPWAELMADLRFGETLYRVAVESGVMDNVRYADVEESIRAA
jgi:hypothetical protein